MMILSVGCFYDPRIVPDIAVFFKVDSYDDIAVYYQQENRVVINGYLENEGSGECKEIKEINVTFSIEEVDNRNYIYLNHEITENMTLKIVSKSREFIEEKNLKEITVASGEKVYLEIEFSFDEEILSEKIEKRSFNSEVLFY